MQEMEYKIGDLINPLPTRERIVRPVGKEVTIRVPARVDTFLCHHQYFVNPPRPQVYPVNSINFTVAQYSEARVQLRDDAELVIDAEAGRESIVRHAVLIMQKTLSIGYGFTISARNLHDIRHGGLGSSAALMTAVAHGINVLFGEPLSADEMTKLLAQNYGEETDKPGYLSTMASIGGAAAASVLGSSVVVVGGEAEIWHVSELPSEYEAIFLFPKHIESIPGVVDIELFQKGFDLFRRLGYDWGGVKEEILRRKIIPAIESGDLSVLFRSINMYTIGGYGDIPQYFRNRWLSHGIFFDKLIHELYYSLFKNLSPSENCFFVSSGGPLIVVITKDVDCAIRSVASFSDFDVTRVKLSRDKPEVTLIQ